MDQNKLKEIVDKKNERREYAVLQTAESIIERIANEQQSIKAAQERIAGLRKDLKSLEVVTLDAAELLGE